MSSYPTLLVVLVFVRIVIKIHKSPLKVGWLEFDWPRRWWWIEVRVAELRGQVLSRLMSAVASDWHPPPSLLFLLPCHVLVPLSAWRTPTQQEIHGGVVDWLFIREVMILADAWTLHTGGTYSWLLILIHLLSCYFVHVIYRRHGCLPPATRRVPDRGTRGVCV